MNGAESLYKELVDGLRLIANPYVVQVASLLGFARVPDERFERCSAGLKGLLVETGLISPAVLRS